MTRGEQAQELARSLGAAFVGGAADMPPEPLDAAILFAPVGDLVPPALAALDRGGTLAIAGIYLSDIPPLNYDRYLFQERQLRSVTSNTREDAREFLAFAAAHKLAVTTHPLPARRRRPRPAPTSRRAASTAPPCSPPDRFLAVRPQLPAGSAVPGCPLISGPRATGILGCTRELT